MGIDEIRTRTMTALQPKPPTSDEDIVGITLEEKNVPPLLHRIYILEKSTGKQYRESCNSVASTRTKNAADSSRTKVESTFRKKTWCQKRKESEKRRISVPCRSTRTTNNSDVFLR